MARPQRSKRVCSEPGFHLFSAACSNGERGVQTLTVEEYETIRLIDVLGVSREDCAKRMNISRTTAQDTYNSARRKIALCIVNGLDLSIDGGTFWLCDGSAGCSDCRKRIAENHDPELKKGLVPKEQHSTRVAVTYEDGDVFQHFGRTGLFKIYDISDGTISRCRLLSSGGTGHSELASLLADNEIDVVICGGIGQRAEDALKGFGIKLIAGVQGGVEDAVSAFLSGTLNYS